MSPSRRDRLRESTLAEIREAARRLLTERGSAAVTINAVAREVGMSGPALYHYFSGHEELVQAVTADFFAELGAAMRAARDARAGGTVAARLLATARAMRGWAIAHPAEFGWIFTSPVPSAVTRSPDSARNLAGRDFELVFQEEIAALWKRSPFPVPDDLAPPIREQLHAYRDKLGIELPVEALYVTTSCWIRLYGLLCMEVLNQIGYIYTDVEPIYEECLRDIAATLGLTYEPPS
ncbi:TetR/AcrR family transcriptional regulator [Actinomadura sp. NAK00032]|uniref:TetR/AcrR family transcriptional regulator n=1 Tax=Actinomadura sp. NAK00032 TaxID=2742128 RepID=UPI001590B8F0|nr:helix-turn-helix domain-containing protein [Actinomadura sp. NAK00032]QKW39149.1 TetR/AcrR family transcriptional regulator [Actinomadura sp. NAK00032]